MLNKKLYITRKDTTTFIESDNNNMYTLYRSMDEIPMGIIKKLIINEIENNNIPMDYHFNTFGVRINDNHTFTFYNLFDVDDQSYYLTIDQDSYWKAIEEYEKLENLAWKKLTISFDGNQVYFDPEY